MSGRPTVTLVEFDKLAEAFDRARQRPGAQTNFALPREPWQLGDGQVTCVAALTPANQAAAIEAVARGADLIVALPDEPWAWPVVRDLDRFGVVQVGTASAPLPSSRLSEDQLSLLRLLASGRSIPDAASSMYLSVRTAERRVGAARRALGVQTTAEAILLIGCQS